MPIKTFRGMITDENQDTIVLHTNNGTTGYRIVKFQIINRGPPGNLNTEAVVKIYKTPQSTVDGVINFSDNRLLAVAYYAEGTSPGVGQGQTVIFDSEIFNQDIYVTYKDTDTSENYCNYYIELEQLPLDLGESTVATLKDIRNND
jgi:hypothetical protein